eukprot:COSAG01_NODE_38689_length_486_cov_1.449612_1_plen_55_part_10
MPGSATDAKKAPKTIEVETERQDTQKTRVPSSLVSMPMTLFETTELVEKVRVKVL